MYNLSKYILYLTLRSVKEYIYITLIKLNKFHIENQITSYMVFQQSMRFRKGKTGLGFRGLSNDKICYSTTLPKNIILWRSGEKIKY